MSWCLYAARASEYRRRHARSGQPAFVYRATVEPQWVLGILFESADWEVVVNPAGLSAALERVLDASG